jgi:hypothetical protein
VMANARRHGDGIRQRADRPRAWELRLRDLRRRSGDRGPAGRLHPPAPQGADGAGLWVARQLTRRLDLLSTAYGLTARLWVQADQPVSRTA